MIPEPVRIDVDLGERSYEVIVESGLIDRAGAALQPLASGGRLLVVSDDRVWELWGDRLTAGLRASAISPIPVLVPPGEDSKSWACLADLIDRLLAHGIERGDHLVAFGGGVVGDLAGFASAIVKRGCNFVQIPTTLLAQVDSSVGGKTGINVAAGKNLIGCFQQPTVVLVDPTCLDTLPLRQLRSGYAEIVKYGLIGDAAFFAWCEEHGAALLAGDPAARHFAIAASIEAKAAIVGADERERTGQRALLNLGHTFAHALEAAAGFSDALLHGEAVALGMVLAFRLSVERGLCDGVQARRVEAHLARMGLPTRLADVPVAASADQLAALMAHDKKARGGRLAFVLARGIGRTFVDEGVEPPELIRFLERQRDPQEA